MRLWLRHTVVLLAAAVACGLSIAVVTVCAGMAAHWLWFLFELGWDVGW